MIRHRRWRRDDAGQIGGVEGVIFGVLVFVIGALVIANAAAIIDAKSSAASAAREATRAFVESRAATTSDALAEARVAAAETLEGLGRDPANMIFTPERAELVRCATATIRVSYPVPLVAIPLLGRHRHAFVASAAYSEVVDPYRSGLADESQCAP